MKKTVLAQSLNIYNQHHSDATVAYVALFSCKHHSSTYRFITKKNIYVRQRLHEWFAVKLGDKRGTQVHDERSVVGECKFRHLLY